MDKAQDKIDSKNLQKQPPRQFSKIKNKIIEQIGNFQEGTPLRTDFRNRSRWLLSNLHNRKKQPKHELKELQKRLKIVRIRL